MPSLICQSMPYCAALVVSREATLRPGNHKLALKPLLRITYLLKNGGLSTYQLHIWFLRAEGAVFCWFLMFFAILGYLLLRSWECFVICKLHREPLEPYLGPFNDYRVLDC